MNQGVRIDLEPRDAHTETLSPARGYALSVIAAGVVIAILYWARIVFITTTLAVIVAFILEPPVVLLLKIRLPRPVASFIVCGLAVLILYFTGLAAWNQLRGIATDVPAFKENLGDLVANVSDRIESIQNSAGALLIPSRKKAPPPVPPAAKKSRRAAPQPATPPTDYIPEVRIHDDHNPITEYIYARLGSLYQFILMSSFVPLLIYFMLSWRDHIYQSFLRFFEGPGRVTASRSLQGIAVMARAFVAGNFMIGAILATLSCIVFALLRLPYPFLIGTVSGFFSLVPYLGLPLALLPVILAVLATGAPSATLLFAAVAVVALHLLGLNVLYPKLVGARVHLNPLVVTFSLMFWGFLWDAAGLILAIPITAGLKAVCDNVPGLMKYGRFLGD